MSGNGNPIIRVEEFTAAYGEKVVVDSISFEVRRGEILVILGGSGSGKSTVLKHMIGLYRPAGGRILIEGRDIGSAKGRSRQEIIRRIGVSYQSGALFGSMTLLENICLPLEEFTALGRDARELTRRVFSAREMVARHEELYDALVD